MGCCKIGTEATTPKLIFSSKYAKSCMSITSISAQPLKNCSCVPVVSCWEVVSHNYSRFDAARWSGDAMDQAFIPLFWWLSVYTNNTAPDLFAVQWIRRLISGRSAQKLLFTNTWTCSFSINEWIVPFKTMACTTAIICVCISNLHNYIIMLNWYKIL